MNDSKTVKTPVCVVLLDHSESMGKTFQEKKANDFSGITQVSNAQIKLDAAKESLIKYISDFKSPKKLILVECSSNASVIFDGLSNNQDEIKEILGSLKTGNGVSLVSAIEIINNYIKDNNYSLVRSLVISDKPQFLSVLDKLQDLEPTVNNQNIDLILVDPIYQAQKFASSLTDIYGSVSVVFNVRYAQSIPEEPLCTAPPLPSFRDDTKATRPPSWLDENVKSAPPS